MFLFLTLIIIYVIISYGITKYNIEEAKMKSTGIIRKVDELGRVVIPIEIRNKFNISQKDPIEIYTEGSSIILKKFEPNCVFCGNTKNLINYRDKLVCKKCAEKIAGLKE